MNSGFSRTLVVVAAAVLGTQPCVGALKVGDAAPKLQVGRWLQGEAVTDFEGDKVYIVEFWATWCGPCKTSIPHLNDLHVRFEDQGLVVIGQNVLENDDSLVAPFVQGMAGKMTYRVAMDDKTDGGRGRMARNWLAAAEQNGIPCAFVINKQGRIVSIGHPMSLKEADLETLLAEPAAAGKAIGTGRPAADTSTAPSAKAQALARRAEAEIRAGDWDRAEASVAELQEALTEKFRDLGGLLNLDLLLARQQNDDALQLAKLLSEDFKGNPVVQIAVASRLARQPGTNAALLAAAEKIATPVSAATGGQQAAALATLARIAFLRGDQPRAVEFQTKAVGCIPAKADATRPQAVLEAYQQGHLPDGEGTAKPR
ncbi:MAG: TlpA disulfide reductase family protein [Verrucomicrobia bacterium]|nr:TlpA disulfide reductase family protein [Verrucomicrobiota bacterium]